MKENNSKLSRAAVLRDPATGPTQMNALVRGDIDIALTAMDNVLGYAEGQAGRGPADLIAVLGVNQGGRSKLVVARDITSIEQLRGRAIAVDAVATGYAFVEMGMGLVKTLSAL